MRRSVCLSVLVGAVALFSLMIIRCTLRSDERGWSTLKGEDTSAVSSLDSGTTALESGRRLEEKCEQLLARLDSLAARLRSGAITLKALRASENEPDATMWDLRKLASGNDSLIAIIEGFIRSETSPGARVFALFAFACPSDKSSVSLLARLITNHPEAIIANAACLCFEVPGGKGIGKGWNSAFGFLLRLGLPPTYSIDSQPLEYRPYDREEYSLLYRPTYQGVDLSPVGDAVMLLLDRAEPSVFKPLILRLADSLARRPEATGSTKERFQEILEISYLSDGKEWATVVELLTDPRAANPDRVLSVMAAGLGRLDENRRLQALEGVSRLSPASLSTAPFQPDVTAALKTLSTGPDRGGPPMDTFVTLMWNAFILSGNVDWSVSVLGGPDSEMLTLRASRAIEVNTSGGVLSVHDASTVVRVGEAFMKSNSAEVNISGAYIIATALNKQPGAVSADEKLHLKSLIRTLVEGQARSQPSTPASLKLAKIMEFVN